MANEYELTPTSDENRGRLPDTGGWPATDSRQLLFTVTVGDTPKDLTNDDVRWRLVEKPYQSRSEAILTDESDGVTLFRDQVVDPTAGEFRIDIDEGTLSEADAWGDLAQRVVVDPADQSAQSWTGRVTVESAGDL